MKRNTPIIKKLHNGLMYSPNHVPLEDAIRRYVCENHNATKWATYGSNAVYSATPILKYIDSRLKKIGEHRNVDRKSSTYFYINDDNSVYFKINVSQHKNLNNEEVYISTNIDIITDDFDKTNDIDDLIKNNVYIDERTKSIINYITYDSVLGLTLKESYFKGKIIENLEDNYGDGFTKDHTNIINFLTNSDSGIVILDGIPGTGKSSYISYLTSLLTNKKFVYLPGNMVESLTKPEFISFALQSLKETILIFTG